MNASRMSDTCGSRHRHTDDEGGHPKSWVTAFIVVEPVYGGAMTVLIVGGSGLLGTELVRQATAAGHTTVATYARKPGAASPTTWCHLDLRDAGSLDAVLSEVRGLRTMLRGAQQFLRPGFII